jgi:hypothetical protein
VVISDHARIVRATLVAGVVSVAGLGLAGCVASPTYGTDKTANQQLLEDITGMLAMGPQRGPRINYKPRPELVKPETTAVLPQPQDDVTTVSNQAWPESPEERLARIRADADENRDSPFFRPTTVTTDPTERNTQVTYDDPLLANMGDGERRQLLRQRRIQQAQGNPNSRQYLSEPPAIYRQPAETAPIGDVGESEWKKERRARARSTPGAATTTPVRSDQNSVLSNLN